MGKKSEILINEFQCPGCKELLPLGTKKCKWCGTFIASPTEQPLEESPPPKKSWFRKNK